MYSHSTRGNEVAATEGWWLLSMLPECVAPKYPDDSLKLVCTSPYILLILYVNRQLQHH